MAQMSGHIGRLVPFPFRKQFFAIMCNMRLIGIRLRQWDALKPALPANRREALEPKYERIRDWQWVARRVTDAYAGNGQHSRNKRRLLALSFRPKRPSPAVLAQSLNISTATYHNWMDEIYTMAYIAAIERGLYSHFGQRRSVEREAMIR